VRARIRIHAHTPAGRVSSARMRHRAQRGLRDWFAGRDGRDSADVHTAGA
jgi:hypothetical protein